MKHEALALLIVAVVAAFVLFVTVGLGLDHFITQMFDGMDLTR